MDGQRRVSAATRVWPAPTPPASRAAVIALARALLPALARVEVRGAENVPLTGPLIMAFNHLGHADPPLIVATTPRELEVMALADLASVPVTGHLLRWYGAIWVRRDDLDRDVLQTSLAALAAGRALALAPEAGISPTGALTHARDGVAWLAARSGAAVLPGAVTGSERAITDLKRLRRPQLTITYGHPMCLPLPDGLPPVERKARLAANTASLMRAIAALLPPSYRGVYA